MELSSSEAGNALGLSSQSVRNQVNAGRLSARHRGVRRQVLIDVSDLRVFACEYNYDLDELYISGLARGSQ